MSIETLLDQTCTTKRPASGSPPGAAYTLTTNLSSQVCRLTSFGILEPGRAQYKLFLPYGTDLLPRDQVIIGSYTYVTDFVDYNPGGAGLHIEGHMSRVTTEAWQDVITIIRAARTQSGGTIGQFIETWAMSTASVTCDIEDATLDASGDYRTETRGAMTHVTHRIKCALGTDVLQGDKALEYNQANAGAAGTGTALTFTVSGAGWTANEWRDNYWLVDKNSAVYKIASNTATVLTLESGTPATGAYSIRQEFDVHAVVGKNTHIEILGERFLG